MAADESLQRLIDSLKHLLEEGRSVQDSLGDLRRAEDSGAVMPSKRVEASFDQLAESVATSLESLHERLSRMNEVLRSMRDEK